MAKDMEKEIYWREVIARWQASGLSMAGFCRQEGVPDKKFFWWKRRIEKRDSKDAAATEVFVPVRIKERSTVSSDGLIELVAPGGFVFRICAGFDKATLSSLLDLVGQHRC